MNLEEQAAREWDLDEAELGTRAAVAMLASEFGALYSRVADRAFSVVLQCYAAMCDAFGPDDVPAEWRPSFRPDGSWRGDGRQL